MNPAPPVRTIPAKPASETAPEGQLGVFDAVNIIVGIVVGTTIFKMAPNIFSHSGSPWMSLLIWGLGGVLAFIGALCYAELATSFPRSGGDYVYLSKAFGPWAGFLFGWTQLTIVLTCSIGVMSVVFGEYASRLYDLTQVVQFGGLDSIFLYAAGSIVIITLLNLIGVVLGKWTQNLLSVLKLIGVFAIVVAGFAFGDWSANGPQTWGSQLAEPLRFGPVEILPWERATIALILVMYAFGGWNDAAFVAAEVRNPQRNIPRALFYGVGLIFLVYLLINAAYLVGLGFDVASHKGVADGEGKLIPLLVLERTPLGELGSKALSAIIMISALGAVNGLIFTGARVYGTLGNDHTLFSWLGHWKPGRGAPILALLVQAVITLSMVAAFGTKPGQDIVNHGLSAISNVANQVTDWTSPPPGEGEEPRQPIDLTIQGDVRPDETFDKLFAVSAPFFWIFFLATGFSLFVLRDQTVGNRPFSVPLFPILPLIFCNVCAWMVYRAYLYVEFRKLTPIFAFFVVVVLLGLPLYWLSRRIGYRDSSEI